MNAWLRQVMDKEMPDVEPSPPSGSWRENAGPEKAKAPVTFVTGAF
jgi:hypothetical protein